LLRLPAYILKLLDIPATNWHSIQKDKKI